MYIIHTTYCIELDEYNMLQCNKAKIVNVCYNRIQKVVVSNKVYFT